MSPVDSIQIDRIKDFCRKWRVQELSLFGSVLRKDFGPGSDIDVLVAFEPDCRPTLEEWASMGEELETLFSGRVVDLVERRLITNPFRRHHILTNRKVLYAA